LSFFMAIFFGLLFCLSAAFNVLMLIPLLGVVAMGAAPGQVRGDVQYVETIVGGDEHAVDRILVLRVEGVISEAADPMLGGQGNSVTRIRRALEHASSNRSIRGVLLRVDSPGGGVTDSDEIHKLIKDYKTRSSLPIVALFGDMAASGGYYVAAASDYIIAHPTCLTGSIGVIISTWNYGKAADKLGIEPVTVLSPHTPYKDILSGARPMRDDERQILGDIVEELYQRFVDIVAAGRPELTREQVQKLADGRIYTGRQALDKGLVDKAGYQDDAVQWLKEATQLDQLALVEYRRVPSFLEEVLGTGRAAASGPSLAQAVSSLTIAARSRLLYLWPGR
jgi:protease-4